MDIRKQFKSCGENVIVEEGVRIPCPEVFEVGNNVRFNSGFVMIDSPGRVVIGDNVTFWQNCFIQGTAELNVGDHVDFYPGAYISLSGSPQGFVRIGCRTHFAPGCALYGFGGLTVGPCCNIAAHAVLATIGHSEEILDRPMCFSPAKGGPIVLEEDVWIGANATVTADVVCAGGSVVGANAVLTRSTEPYGIYTGVPARLLRYR